MQTALIQTYKVDIDFDEASKAWKQNKKYVGNGTYKYICPCFTKKGDKCERIIWKDGDTCYIHKTQNII